MPKIKRVELEREFTAQDEAGTKYRLRVFRTILDSATFGNPNAESPGLAEIRTADGRAVNPVGSGKYEIVGYPNIVVTSIDPQAP